MTALVWGTELVWINYPNSSTCLEGFVDAGTAACLDKLSGWAATFLEGVSPCIGTAACLDKLLTWTALVCSIFLSVQGPQLVTALCRRSSTF